MKGATRLKLLVAGVLLTVVATVLWVAFISVGWDTSDRSTVFLVLRCMYSLGYAGLAGAQHYYLRERKQRHPSRPLTVIAVVIAMTYVCTVYLVARFLEWYPDGLSSIRFVLIYTMVLILLGIADPVHYYAARYYRRRKGTLPGDRACCSGENKEA